MRRSTTSTSRADAAKTCRVATSCFSRRRTCSRSLTEFGTIALVPGAGTGADVVFPIRHPDAIDRDIKRLRRIVRDGMPTIILCDNEGQAERLDELLNEDTFAPSPAALVIGVLDGGFVIPPVAEVDSRFPIPDSRQSGLRVLTDHEIFRRERRLRRARRYTTGATLEAITALKSGDFVVHLEHGVGIYRGLQTIFVGESTVEVAVIEYEGGDRLNVPLYRIDQIERYRAAGDADGDAAPPRLHKLGGKRWAQQRDRTRAAIQEMTVELLDLYARRQVASRPPHFPDTRVATPARVLVPLRGHARSAEGHGRRQGDMEKPRPMDRLLVGDVGYGKTEIAVRAAFKAVQSDRQVAVLVPDDDSRRSASADVQRALRRLPDSRRRVEPVPVGQGADGHAGGARREEGGHHHRHPPSAESRR